MFNMREQFKLHDNVMQEETKDTTSGKFSEQVVQGSFFRSCKKIQCDIQIK